MRSALFECVCLNLQQDSCCFDALFGPKISKKRLFGANRDQIGTNFCKVVSLETFRLKRDHSGSSASTLTFPWVWPYQPPVQFGIMTDCIIVPSTLGTDWVFELIGTWLWLGLRVGGQRSTIKYHNRHRLPLLDFIFICDWMSLYFLEDYVLVFHLGIKSFSI